MPPASARHAADKAVQPDGTAVSQKAPHTVPSASASSLRASQEGGSSDDGGGDDEDDDDESSAGKDELSSLDGELAHQDGDIQSTQFNAALPAAWQGPLDSDVPSADEAGMTEEQRRFLEDLRKAPSKKRKCAPDLLPSFLGPGAAWLGHALACGGCMAP